MSALSSLSLDMHGLQLFDNARNLSLDMPAASPSLTLGGYAYGGGAGGDTTTAAMFMHALQMTNTASA